MRLRSLGAVAFGATIIAAGCSATPAVPSGSIPSAAASASVPAPSSAPVSAAPATAAPSSAPASDPGKSASTGGGLESVQPATIRIEATGSFVDPEFGESVQAGQGSGFIIDESGIAVTNNHVVTGANLFRVYVGGDNNNAVNATVLGASECSDLAVIDLEGDGYPVLEWFEGTPAAGITVNAAGYPENQFRLTEGTVNTAASEQSTQWASANRVLEHSADIIPGNSGGPLVDDQGRVVGINYATIGETRNFAISVEEARGIVDQLRQRQEVNSIGVNGIAVTSDDGTLAGIWAAAVKAGSPAGNVGVKSGDLITELGGIPVGTDGTMNDYCDILRSHNPGDPLDIEVLDFDVSQCFEGQLNVPDRRLTEITCPGAAVVSPGPVTGDAEATLRSHIPAAFAADCTTFTPFSGALASLYCLPPSGDVEFVYYDLFPDAASMNSQYDTLVANSGVSRDTGDCSQGPAEGSYTVGGTEAGRAVCLENLSGNAQIQWTDDELFILATAARPDRRFGRLQQWWLSAESGPVR